MRETERQDIEVLKHISHQHQMQIEKLKAKLNDLELPPMWLMFLQSISTLILAIAIIVNIVILFAK